MTPKQSSPPEAGTANFTANLARIPGQEGDAAVRAAAEALYLSVDACAIRDEIVRVGQKLWQRNYVDGCGGNISVRIGDFVLCTPTMLSKADLKPEDICMTDLFGALLVGSRPRTSELLLHLSIYRANSKARAVVHCHPPHATAYALVGVEPPVGYLVEQDLFVGPVALAPYETPGTAALSETVLPLIQNHNTVLLANHGVVSWSDSATHAEWLIEIVDTYCQVLILANQIGGPKKALPPEKIAELLCLKLRMGLPDSRLNPPAGRAPGWDGSSNVETS